jgi:hypothetical protein
MSTELCCDLPHYFENLLRSGRIVFSQFLVGKIIGACQLRRMKTTSLTSSASRITILAITLDNENSER